MSIKLTQANIRFIDTYLKNSGVEFIDVRYEMTDHVASALEEQMEIEQTDFYEAFKAFMVKHKKELLENISSFHKKANIRVLKMLLKNTVNPLIFLTLVGLSLLMIVHPLFFTEHFSYALITIFLLDFIFTIFSINPIKEGKKYSSIFYLNQYRVVVTYGVVFLISSRITNEVFAFVSLWSVIWLSVIFYRTTKQLLVYYRKNYAKA